VAAMPVGFLELGIDFFDGENLVGDVQFVEVNHWKESPCVYMYMIPAVTPSWGIVKGLKS
jgi:hypothetical protein